MPRKAKPRTRRKAGPFDRTVRKALRELPADLKGALATVAISIQHRPSPALLKQLGLRPGSSLYGLFEGWDLKSLPAGEPRLVADRIILFEDCLRQDFPEPKDLAREVRTTLIHELGHFFGFDEKALKARGWG